MSERLEKLAKIKSLGINPYPEKFERTHKNTEALKLAEKNGVRETDAVLENPKSEIKLCGRMMTFRSHGKLSFAQMQDVSGRIQLCFVKNKTIVSGLKTPLRSPAKFSEVGRGQGGVVNNEVESSKLKVQSMSLSSIEDNQANISQETNKQNIKVQVGDIEPTNFVDSVHLTDWPEVDDKLLNAKLNTEMSAIQQIVKDTVFSDTKKVEALSWLIADKTGGNPFFVTEFFSSCKP